LRLSPAASELERRELRGNSSYSPRGFVRERYKYIGPEFNPDDSRTGKLREGDGGSDQFRGTLDPLGKAGPPIG
jgi:hypothetical protein